MSTDRFLPPDTGRSKEERARSSFVEALWQIPGMGPETRFKLARAAADWAQASYSQAVEDITGAVDEAFGKGKLDEYELVKKEKK